MSGLLEWLAVIPQLDYAVAAHRDLYIWVRFHHPRTPVANEN